MNVGDVFDLTVESLALSGEGIARRDGLVFFVDGALPSEEVKVRVTKIEKNLIRAAMNEVTKQSPERVSPPCPHFGVCGGCSFQHLKYAKQLEIKYHELAQMIKHLGGFKEPIQIHPVIASPNQYFYRNSVAMTVRHDMKTKEPFLGFVGKDNRTFLAIKECVIAEKRINSNLAAVKNRFWQLIPEPKRFRTSQVVIRIGGGESVYTSIKKDPEAVQELCIEVSGKKFYYSGSSFFQTNFSILEPMIEAVRKYLVQNLDSEMPDQKDSILIDLYCGVGFFSVSLADSFVRVFGIEEGEEAVAYAVRNSNANQIQNIKFTSGKVENLLDKITTNENPNHSILVDPPRIGMKKEVCEHLTKLHNIQRLVYVSCNPATFIRDAQILSSRFRIKEIQPLDMFPNTKHLELVALLVPHS